MGVATQPKHIDEVESWGAIRVRVLGSWWKSPTSRRSYFEKCPKRMEVTLIPRLCVTPGLREGDQDEGEMKKS